MTAAPIGPQASLASGMALDATTLSRLKNRAAADPKAAVREAARQFETLFMQEMMKSMRAATLSSGLMDNETTRMGTEMLDAQFAAGASGRPGGLADLLARQLERQMNLRPADLVVPSGAGKAAAEPLSSLTPREPRIPDQRAADFIQRHRASAQAASAASGIAAPFMVAQAAHESGWGASEIRHADGTTSHNLFGIKAGAGWKGPVAEVMTTEVVNGEAIKLRQRFRAYGSYDEAFADYARLVGGSPRYREVAAAGGDAQRFAQGLQRAGYATDPAYATKLERVINTTLRLQRTQA
ncbi:MAG: flagellar assembly peptidoglycan hydrolase FlgJ [Aquabacterium sp.]